MGTSYDLYCLDCESKAHVSADHDPIRQYELQPLLEHASAIGNLAKLVKDYCWVLNQYGHGGVEAPVEWLAEHHSHRIRTITQYGEIEGQCLKKIRCKECDTAKGQCGKDVGHEGECGQAVVRAYR